MHFHFYCGFIWGFFCLRLTLNLYRACKGFTGFGAGRGLNLEQSKCTEFNRPKLSLIVLFENIRQIIFWKLKQFACVVSQRLKILQDIPD